MGCDIHLHTEVMIDGKWEHYSCPSIRRNYELFDYMAGVRGDGEGSISPPKGIPTELSAVTALDLKEWGPDAHSASYFYRDDIEKLMEWTENRILGSKEYMFAEDIFGYLFGNSWNDYDDWPSEIQNIRFIFWFDN